MGHLGQVPRLPELLFIINIWAGPASQGVGRGMAIGVQCAVRPGGVRDPALRSIDSWSMGVIFLSGL